MQYTNLGKMYKNTKEMPDDWMYEGMTPQDTGYEFGGNQPSTPSPYDLSYNIGGRGGNLNIGGVGEDPSVGGPGNLGLSNPPENMWNYTDTGGGETDIPNWLKTILGEGGDAVSGATKNWITDPTTIGALGTAAQQWHNAESYDDAGEAWKKEGNPFGEYRDGYAQKLNALYEDPSSIENTPGYKFRMAQGMNQLSPKLAAQHGSVGSGFASMQNYVQGLASTEYDNEVKRLMGLSGANIGPEASLRAQQGALDAKVNAQNGALQSIGTILGNQGAKGNGITINNNNGGSGGGTPNSRNTVAGQAGAAAAEAIRQGGQAGMQVIGKLIDGGFRFINNPDGSVTDLYAAARAGGGDVESGTYPAYPTESWGPEWNQIPTDPSLPTDSGYEFGGNDFSGGNDYGTTDPQIIEDIESFFDWG